MPPKNHGDEPEPIGYVYFIHEVSRNGRGRIKIGYSLGSPNRRFHNINVCCPRDIEKFGLMRATYSHEQALHDRFGKFRRRGEWFACNAGLLAYIAENTQDWDALLTEEMEIMSDREAAKLDDMFGRCLSGVVDGTARSVRTKAGYSINGKKLGRPRTPTGQKKRSPKPKDKVTFKPGIGRRYGPLQALLDAAAAMPPAPPRAAPSTTPEP